MRKMKATYLNRIPLTVNVFTQASCKGNHDNLKLPNIIFNFYFNQNLPSPAVYLLLVSMLSKIMTRLFYYLTVLHLLTGLHL